MQSCNSIARWAEDGSHKIENALDVHIVQKVQSVKDDGRKKVWFQGSGFGSQVWVSSQRNVDEIQSDSRRSGWRLPWCDCRHRPLHLCLRQGLVLPYR